MNTVILGTGWGDEGKAKIVSDLSIDYDWVIRFAGGDNCGGKVMRGNFTFIHHLLPAVDHSKSRAKSFLASGMVINMPALLEEIQMIQKEYPNIGKSIVVDPDAFIVKPEHIEEDKLVGHNQGTTFRGIRQAYRSKVDRTGTRVYDLINNNAPIIKALRDVGVEFIPLLKLREKMEKSNLLFEGNQGIMLGLESGIYPYITSSDTGIGGVVSSGFHFVKFNNVYGIAKGGYITRSGGRPLPTEMPEEEAKAIVERGDEKGNTTGRSRGCAYMDLVALDYACRRGGVNKLILTKLDISNGQCDIKVCVSYGKKVFSPGDFRNLEPQYINLSGWRDSRNLIEVKSFFDFVEGYTGIDVEYYSCGVSREDLIKIN